MARQKFNILNNRNTADSPAQETPVTQETSDTSSLVSSMLERLDTPKYSNPLDNYKIIPRNKVRDNKKNDYPIVEIDSLKESILHFGLVQDIVVIYLTDEDMYVIEAGHRRRTAIDALIKEFSDYDGSDPERYALYQKHVAKYEYGYVCKVSGSISENEPYDTNNPDDLQQISEDAIDSEIRLIITNKEVRTENLETTTRNIQRLAKLYERKNINLKGSERINVNKQIGKDVGLSPREVAYYKSTDKLIPELKEELFAKKITLKEGSGIAKLPIAEQKEILQLIQEDASKQELQATIASLKKQIKTLESTSPIPASSSKLIKSELMMKSSLEHATASIQMLLKNISAYQKIRDGSADTLDNNMYSDDDILKHKQTLIDLLS